MTSFMAHPYFDSPVMRQKREPESVFEYLMTCERVRSRLSRVRVLEPVRH